MNSISSLGKKAREAEVIMRSMPTDQKNKALLFIADALLSHGDEILKANQTDLENAVAAGMAPGMQDRLRLTKDRLDDIAEGMRQVADLPDPIGAPSSTLLPTCSKNSSSSSNISSIRTSLSSH